MGSVAVTAPGIVHVFAWAGAVLGPPVALYLWLRLDREDRLAKDVVAKLALFAAAWVLGVWAFLVEPASLTVRHVEIASAQWRGPPLRIGVVSDTHVGAPPISDGRLAKLMDRLSAEKPDVVTFLGDYAYGHELQARRQPGDRDEILRGAAVLGRARAPLGLYGVLGNHDWWFGGPAIEQASAAAGVRMLANSAVRVPRPGGAFWIAGVEDPVSTRAQPDPVAAIRAVPAEEPVILIAHQPDAFAQAPARVALTLAGHTHCGQVRLPFLGAVAHPSEGSRTWNCGAYADGARKLFVTGGVGTSILPVRFRAPPEIVIVTLRQGR